MHRNIFKLFKSSIPLLALTYYTAHPYHNFFWRSKKQPNLIKDRVFLDAEISNKPCEDRSSIQQLKSIDGYAVAVFDGHGGWQVVSYFRYFSRICAPKCCLIGWMNAWLAIRTKLRMKKS